MLADPLRTAMRLRCVGKKRYASYAEACAVARARTQSGARDRAAFLQPYPCEHGCGGYHLTSRPHRDRIAEFPVIGAWSDESATSSATAVPSTQGRGE